MSLKSDLMSLCFTSSRKNIFPLFSSLSFLVLKFAFKCECVCVVYVHVWYVCMCCVGVYVCGDWVYVCVHVCDVCTCGICTYVWVCGPVHYLWRLEVNFS